MAEVIEKIRQQDARRLINLHTVKFMAEDFARLNRYLRVCREAGRRYGIDPLFVTTQANLRDGIVEVVHQSKLSRRRNRRVFTFSYEGTPRVVTSNRFVPPNRVLTFSDMGVYNAQADCSDDDAEIEIREDRVHNFDAPVGFEEADKLFSKANYYKFPPEFLLRTLVGTYALGVREFLESKDGKRLRRALEKVR